MTSHRWGIRWFLVLSATVVIVGSALAANGNCPNGLPYCFTAGTPALADNINHNFAQMREWVETKVGSVTSSGITAQSAATFNSTALFNGAVTMDGGVAMSGSVTMSGGVTANTLSVTGTNGVTIANDLTARTVYQSGYRTSCANGIFNFAYGYCCRISVRTGGTDCRMGSASGWVVMNAPFAATANGSYSLSCAAGAPGLTYPYCCRTNDVSGSVECAEWTGWVNPNWRSLGNPY